MTEATRATDERRRRRGHDPKVDVSVDCGLVVNPDRVRAQFEGAVIMALSNTLYSDISIEQGRIEQRSFGD